MDKLSHLARYETTISNHTLSMKHLNFLQQYPTLIYIPLDSSNLTQIDILIKMIILQEYQTERQLKPKIKFSKFRVDPNSDIGNLMITLKQVCNSKDFQ
jgi:hypothetical protein